MALFFSTVINKVDRKGRVSVPAGFRTALEGQSFHGVILFRSFRLHALEGCGIDRMEEMSARVDALPQFSEDREALASIFADAQQLPFDSEGRINLPPALCGHASITDSVAFVGQGRTFQLWEPQRFEKHQEEMRERARRQGTTLPAHPGGAAGRTAPPRESEPL